MFPSERYGAAGDAFTACTYDCDPTKPIGRWKEAWEAAKVRARVSCRFHDLRHTGCTRMLEGGVPFAVVADVMGWSSSTTIRMAKRLRSHRADGAASGRGVVERSELRFSRGTEMGTIGQRRGCKNGQLIEKASGNGTRLTWKPMVDT